MIRNRRPLGGLLILVIVSVCAGCRGTTPATHFYTLGAVSAQQAAPAPSDSAPPAVGVGPIRLPSMLARAQIVTRGTAYRVQVNDFHRWAGSLEENLTQVMMDNLAAMLTPHPVLAFPWTAVVPRYRVSVDVHRLDGDLETAAALSATWTIVDTETDAVLQSKRFATTQPVNTADYESLVAAQSIAVGRLCEDIAGAMTPLIQARP